MYDEAMVFYSLIDFYPKKEIIFNKYQSYNIKQKEIYKMYVYSLPFMDDNTKDLIWEYLNCWQESRDDLDKKYNEAKKRYDKRREIYEMQHNAETRQLE